MKAVLSTLIILAISGNASAENKTLLEAVADRNKKEATTIRESTRGDAPRQHYIDPYRQLRESRRDDFSKKCNLKESKNFNAYNKCHDTAMKEYREQYPDRGTDEYGKKNYANLTKIEAENKRDELLKLMDIASFFSKPGNEEIELTIDHISREISYIEQYVLGVTPKDYRPHK